MKFQFISDLDEYFCEQYANYDKLCILPGYRMPKMQETREDDFGRKYSYTLPANTMSLIHQEKREELLAELKNRMSDKNFSFSFRPLGFFAQVGDAFSKTSFKKIFAEIARQRSIAPKTVGEWLAIEPSIWKKILKGSFYPSKNLLFAMGIAMHLNYREAKMLLNVCGYDFQFEEVQDTVMSYLLSRGVYNTEMVGAALEEYKLQPLLLKV
jgi:hypothetical protein